MSFLFPSQKAGGIDSIFLSALSEPPSKFDTHIPDTLQNHLFEVQTSATTIVAEDLAAFNVFELLNHHHHIQKINICF